MRSRRANSKPCIPGIARSRSTAPNGVALNMLIAVYAVVRNVYLVSKG